MCVFSEGRVECVAIVGQESLSNDTTLQIYTVEMSAPQSAVLRGSSAQITCRITPTPPANDVLTLVWCHNGETLSSSTHSKGSHECPYSLILETDITVLYNYFVNFKKLIEI